MKRHPLVLVTLLTFSGALAQGSYFGLQLSGIVGAGSVFPFCTAGCAPGEVAI